MKKLAILTAALAIFLMGVAQVAMATLIDDTINTLGSHAYSDQWGGYQYDWLISTTTFNPVAGSSALTLSGSVKNLSFGHNDNWLDIGLVDKTVANAALAPGGNPTSMNNHSAYFLVGKDVNGIYFEAGDSGSKTASAQTLGNITAFDFIVTVSPNSSGLGGTFAVTINGKTSSIAYGDDAAEFNGAAYVVAHAYAQLSTDPTSSVYAEVKVVPLPGTLVLLGSGLAGLAFRRQRRTVGRQS